MQCIALNCACECCAVIPEGTIWSVPQHRGFHKVMRVSHDAMQVVILIC